jgi:hypothetical protein
VNGGYLSTLSQGGNDTQPYWANSWRKFDETRSLIKLPTFRLCALETWFNFLDPFGAPHNLGQISAKPPCGHATRDAFVTTLLTLQRAAYIYYLALRLFSATSLYLLARSLGFHFTLLWTVTLQQLF